MSSSPQCEDTVRGKPFTSRKESSPQKPAPMASCSWTLELYENIFLLSKLPGLWYFIITALADQYTNYSV